MARLGRLMAGLMRVTAVEWPDSLRKSAHGCCLTSNSYPPKPPVWPHHRGRPALVTTISVALLLTTSVRVLVQASPRRSVTTIGVPRSWLLAGRSAFEHGAPALVELARRPPRDRPFLRVWCQGVGWRLVGLGRVGLLVG